ncbi:hypothetical protein, partial [Klebsiella aerogenes]|uniref:hypothetical protein n=1 Tax=Klebsiella aerogenes TaxID=548 RepID=UPI001954B56A
SEVDADAEQRAVEIVPRAAGASGDRRVRSQLEIGMARFAAGPGSDRRRPPSRAAAFPFGI